MSRAVAAMALTLALVVAAGYVAFQHGQLARDSAALAEMDCQARSLRHACVMENRTRQELASLDRRRLQRLARDRGYLLPGEVDWWVIERQNALRWPEIWGTMDIGEFR